MSRKNSYFGRRNRSSNQHDFGQIPSASVQRSVFNRSSSYKTTFDAGWLVPIFLDEALPGDTFHLKTSVLARLSTPIVPFMDNLKMDIHYFSVPYRLVWDNWQKFNGEQDNPGDSIDYLIPQLTSKFTDDDGNPVDNGFMAGSLADYFGVPVNIPGLSINALPFRAYDLIYKEWYRDQNLCDTPWMTKGDEDTNLANPVLRKRGKRHDYFTSCLPWPQKGDGVELALGTPQIIANHSGLNFAIRDPDSDVPNVAGLVLNPDGSVTGSGVFPASSVDFVGYYDSEHTGFSITGSESLTINSMRQAFQLQRLMERDARGGTRYTEIIRSHFGVISPDSRVQRPEYLGGGTFDININPVLQNSSTDSTSPQGNLAAFGVTSGVHRGFSQSFVEHCFVIGIASVRADLTYQQGLPRLFSRKTRFDHYWPTLAHLGEQAVLNKEIYAQGSNATDPQTGDLVDDSVFGYQERYAEYRYRPSQITGKMRSTSTDADGNPDSLDVWHLAQKFDSLPTLNATFIEENPPLDRVLAVQTEPAILMDAFFDLRCARPMPVYSVPGYIDHF